MEPEALLELLFVAANAATPEEEARVAWRASDHMWRSIGNYDLGFCRAFNNLCQDCNQNKNWPWVENLWSFDEIQSMRDLLKKYGAVEITKKEEI